MKIGVLTFFESDNYGTVLQAYALQAYLEKLGHEVEIIRLNRNVFAQSPSKASYVRVYSLGQRLQYKLLHGLRKVDEREKKRRFVAFREEYLHTTRKLYVDGKAFARELDGFDLIVSGGDQIWNPYHKSFSLDYFCQFLPKGFPRIACGSSFGIAHIEDGEILGQMQECLEQYRSVLIREESGVEIVKALGIPANQVVDPVFLDRTLWDQFVTKETPVSKPYAVVYALVDYPESDDAAIRQYARDRKMKVVILPENRRNYQNRYQKAFDLGPGDFMNLIAHSEVVFTNSFHGAAFALLMKKRVALLNICTQEAKNKQIRLIDLFSKYNVQGYEITALHEPFACSSKRVEEEAARSRQLLVKALTECMEEKMERERNE